MTPDPTLIEQELLPCPVPWCKADLGPKPIRWPVVATKTTQWAVHCDDCDIYGPVGETEAEAIERWNDRTLQGSAALPSEAITQALAQIDEAERAMIEQRKVEYGSRFNASQEASIKVSHYQQRLGVKAVEAAMRATTPTAPDQDTGVPCGPGSRASHEASISVESSPEASIPNAVTISGELYAFLMGEGPLEGVWFGDLNAGLRGRFWWRALLRCAAGWPASAIETEGGDVKQAPSHSDESAGPEGHRP